MANELQAYTTTGLTVYSVLLNSVGQVWNGSTFVTINSANWTDYDIAMTEATAGIYLGDMPAAAAGGYAYVAYEQAGASPAVTDTTPGDGYIEWNGSAELDLADLATPTNITAGTITTVTNLTNAPTNGDLTATMKTSVTTAASAATPALSAAGVDAILDEIVIGDKTLRQAITIIMAKLVGVATGGGSTTISYNGVNGASNVIVETVDIATGNRSAVTLTV